MYKHKYIFREWKDNPQTNENGYRRGREQDGGMKLRLLWQYQLLSIMFYYMIKKQN